MLHLFCYDTRRKQQLIDFTAPNIATITTLASKKASKKWGPQNHNYSVKKNDIYSYKCVY